MKLSKILQDPWFLKDHPLLDLEIQDLACIIIVETSSFAIHDLACQNNIENDLGCQILNLQGWKFKIWPAKYRDLEVSNDKCKTLQEDKASLLIFANLGQ